MCLFSETGRVETGIWEVGDWINSISHWGPRSLSEGCSVVHLFENQENIFMMFSHYLFSQGMCSICSCLCVCNAKAWILFKDFWMSLATACFLSRVVRLQLECDGKDRNFHDLGTLSKKLVKKTVVPNSLNASSKASHGSWFTTSNKVPEANTNTHTQITYLF